MIEPSPGAMVLLSAAHDRLRRALVRFDEATRERAVVASAGVGVAAAAAVETGVMRIEGMGRDAVKTSAWMLLGLAFGLGLALGRRPAREKAFGLSGWRVSNGVW